MSGLKNSMFQTHAIPILILITFINTVFCVCFLSHVILGTLGWTVNLNQNLENSDFLAETFDLAAISCLDEFSL